MQISLEYARQQDILDPIQSYRDLFHFPLTKKGGKVIYFCGNSLGLQPKLANNYVQEEMGRWADLAVTGHFEGSPSWTDYEFSLAQTMSKIVGASSQEIVIMNTLTVNIHLMLVSFYKPTKSRYKILVEHSPFPSDLYAIKSQIRNHGLRVEDVLIELKPLEGEYTIRQEIVLDLIREQGEKIALVYFGSVNYLNGQALNTPAIIEASHAVGAYFGLDLAHGAGNLPVQLHEWNVDFAVWCNYKYLNGGPNSLASCFIHQNHLKASLPRLEGWWGHNAQRRFLMERDFNPMSGADAWKLSGPPILSMAGMRASLEYFDQIGMTILRAKSINLTNYLEHLLKEIKSDLFHIISPSEPAQRGCQLSLFINNSNKTVYFKLLESGIVIDWREPGIIRVAPTPMYNSFEDVFHFYETFKEIIYSK